MPLFSGERVLPPCRRMALSPPGVDRVITLLAGQPLRLCGENIDQPLALWQPWAFPGEWALSSVGIVAPWLDFNIMTQRGRASATVQVVSDLQCPASEGLLMFYKASGIWPGGAARPAAASAGAVDPRGICVPWAAMDACCWRRSRSNNRQEMIYCSYRDVLLPARRGPAEKYRDTRGRQWDIIPG